MKAVILVGGEGTRLRPLTCNTPKAMLPLANRPFLEHIFDYLKHYGIWEVVLSMGYKPDAIEKHFGDGSDFGINLTYVVEDKPLGTAGGVKNVEQHIDGTCLVFNGDILTDLDLSAIIDFHRQNKGKVSIALIPVEDPTAYGLVETDANQRVTAFIEKPTPDRVTTNLINAGTYVMEPDVLDLVPPDTYYMFERGVFPELLARGEPVFGYPYNGYWMDIGTPAKYLAAHHDLLTGRLDRDLPGSLLREDVWIGERCEIPLTARLSGPVVLGDRVYIEGGATIVGPTVIGDDCHIGPGACVEGSVIWSGTTIGPQANVRNSLVGRGCTVAGGAWLTGGTVVADGAAIGPGNRLDRGVRIWPGKTIEENTITF